MNTIVKADAGGLVWLIVGVFWVIAQIAGAAAKKKKAPPHPDEEGVAGEQAGDPFADLMRKLAGVQEIKAPILPEPVEIQAKAARSERLAPPTGSEFTGRATPPAEPNRREAPQKTNPPTEEVPDVDIRPTMSSFQSAIPSMKLPSIKMSFQPSGKSSVSVSKIGKIIPTSNRSALRRAMLSHIIFSPPKALKQWNGGIVE